MPSIATLATVLSSTQLRASLVPVARRSEGTPSERATNNLAAQEEPSAFLLSPHLNCIIPECIFCSKMRGENLVVDSNAVGCIKTQRSRESRHRRNIWQCTKGGSRLRSPASLDFRPLRRRLVLSVSSSRSNHSRKSLSKYGRRVNRRTHSLSFIGRPQPPSRLMPLKIRS